MASTLALEAVPNQSISVTLDNDIYDITIKASSDVMLATIARNGETIIDSFRCLSQTPLLPYSYMEKGNFLFVPDVVSSTTIPYYTDFGNEYVLVYLTQEELEEALNG